MPETEANLKRKLNKVHQQNILNMAEVLAYKCDKSVSILIDA
jgi:hypothetical protein